MRRLSQKLTLIVFALGAVLALAACGSSHTKVTGGTYAGESGANAPYLNVGPLIYEVQLSRQLNPNNPQEATYLEGLTSAQRTLAPGQEWFAVFVQVYNQTARTQLATTNLTISDTQGDIYSPIVPSGSNLFAYRGGAIGAHSRLPELNSVAANGPTQGALLLYKIKTVSLDNRPLQLKIVDQQDPRATAAAELDV